MVRYVIYAGIVAVAAIAGAALTQPAPTAPGDDRPPSMTINQSAVVSPPDPSTASVPSRAAQPRRATTSEVASSVPSPDPGAHEPGAHDHPPDDGDPLTVTDVAASFVLAVLSDRHDTSPADRAAALAVWAEPPVTDPWPAMTDEQRVALTVRSATIAAAAIQQLDTHTWTADVDATVTTSSAHGPTTAATARLELRLEADPVTDDLQVTAAAVIVEGPAP